MKLTDEERAIVKAMRNETGCGESCCSDDDLLALADILYVGPAPAQKSADAADRKADG